MLSDGTAYKEFAAAFDEYNGVSEVYGIIIDPNFDGEFPVEIAFEDMITGKKVKFQISKLLED